jgi:hypothetical protein
MKVVFHTDNIDETFYRQIIHQYLSDLLNANLSHGERYIRFRNDWTVHIYPAKDWDGIDGRSSNTGTLNAMIPHGVTGEGIVKAYVIDVDDKGLTSLQNFSAILHEVSHMYLIMTMRGIRGILRNNDLSGNRKGKEMNVSTQEIHDHQQEGKFYQLKTWVNTGSWWKRKWSRYTCIAIDLSSFLKNTM